MIIVLEPNLPAETIRRVEEAARAAGADPKRLSSSTAEIAIDARGADRSKLEGLPGVKAVFSGAPPYPKVARRSDRTRAIPVGETSIGGSELAIVAGPCAVESEEQLEKCAAAVAASGAKILRGGAFKPRTSPYSFQGLERDGLRLLRDAADRHRLAVVTEVLDVENVAVVSEHADMVQIGSRNMQNFPLLRACGRSRRPVLLKRGMSATLEEWLLAAEYVASAGNDRVILCERGVRSFDPAARNLLDLAAVPLLREKTDLPVVVDPSHGIGVRSAIPHAARAAVAIGADGVMIEAHPDPGTAKSDGFQALRLDELGPLVESLARVRRAIQAILRVSARAFALRCAPMIRRAIVSTSVLTVLFSASAARADDVLLSTGIGVLGAFGGNFLSKPSDTTYTLNGETGKIADPYPGFSGTTSGYGLSAEARLLQLVGLEVDAIHLSGKGTGSVTINNYGFTAEIDQTAWHVPVTVKGVIPLPLVAPFALLGREFVFVGSTGASETANPGTPAVYGIPVTSKGGNYGMWTFGVGAEVKLPIPGIDLRIPIAFRGSYNAVSDHLQDRVTYTIAPSGQATGKQFDTTWQWQAWGTIGAQIWF